MKIKHYYPTYRAAKKAFEKRYGITYHSSIKIFEANGIGIYDTIGQFPNRTPQKRWFLGTREESRR